MTSSTSTFSPNLTELRDRSVKARDVTNQETLLMTFFTLFYREEETIRAAMASWTMASITERSESWSDFLGFARVRSRRVASSEVAREHYGKATRAKRDETKGNEGNE